MKLKGKRTKRQNNLESSDRSDMKMNKLMT